MWLWGPEAAYSFIRPRGAPLRGRIASREAFIQRFITAFVLVLFFGRWGLFPVGFRCVGHGLDSLLNIFTIRLHDAAGPVMKWRRGRCWCIKGKRLIRNAGRIFPRKGRAGRWYGRLARYLGEGCQHCGSHSGCSWKTGSCSLSAHRSSLPVSWALRWSPLAEAVYADLTFRFICPPLYSGAGAGFTRSGRSHVRIMAFPS